VWALTTIGFGLLAKRIGIFDFRILKLNKK
jgi:hypothetical protein